MKHLLIDRCGKAGGDIDSISHTASGNSYGVRDYKFGIALIDKPDVRKLMYDMATQSRSIEFWESGTHHLTYIPVTVDPVDKTLDSRIDLDTISIRPANRANIKNKMSATYDKEWSGKGEIESEQAVVKANSPDSIAKYGTLEADRLSFSFIKEFDQAVDALYWMQANQKDAILLLDFIGGHHLMEIEKGDIIDFAFAVGDQLDKAFLGLISTDATFRVVDVLYENENVKLLLETGTDGLTPPFNLIGFNPLGGYYESVQDVELTTSVVDGDIYYTTDGSDPDTGDTLYTGTPIVAAENITIKARLFVDGQVAGPIQTEVYEIFIETWWRIKAGQFGSETAIRSMIVFDGKIYGGSSPGGKLLEWNGVNAWVEKAAVSGNYVFSLGVFNGKLYGGMGLDDGDLYEWNGVDDWVSVAPQHGDEVRIYSLIEYNGKLYGGTYPYGHLLEWNGVDAWVQKADLLTGAVIASLLEFNGKLYGSGADADGDASLWEWNDTDAWVQVAKGGVESAVNAYDLTIFNGKLYAGSANEGKLLEWNEVDAWIERAPQLSGQTYISALVVHDSKLYGGTGQNSTLFKWNDVDAWVEASGQSGNEIFIIGLLVFNNKVYCGTVGTGQLHEYVGLV
ncbi:chitobiase/beta-hexosaminidase C-terminal domain-containing protein [Candidatus Pacearchaeota archaeon]|nr:chitobiase/beta-hexosaminidase C-terminal domain-containing protein [Candidatus Pacearchaeota archaeon]